MKRKARASSKQGDRGFADIVEALDRLSRDMEDLAGIHKRLSFLGIEISAVLAGCYPAGRLKLPAVSTR